MCANENDAQKKYQKNNLKSSKNVAFYVKTYSNRIIACIDQSSFYIIVHFQEYYNHF